MVDVFKHVLFPTDKSQLYKEISVLCAQTWRVCQHYSKDIIDIALSILVNFTLDPVTVEIHEDVVYDTGSSGISCPLFGIVL